MQRWHKIGIGIVLVLLVLFPRVLDLDDFRSPDEDRWIANTNGFVVALAHGRLDNLVKLPHPGITLQWAGAVTNQYDSWAIKRLPIAIVNSLLILATGYVLGRRWGWRAGGLTILVLAANPLLYAHSRVYAMDSFLALFFVLSISLLLLWQHDQKKRYLVAAAFCAAAAGLSKMTGVLIIPTTLILLWYWHHSGKLLAVWGAAFVVSAALILPTLAINPLSVLGDMTELFRSGDYQDHQQGPWWYLRSIVFFSTPTQWIAIIAAMALFVRAPRKALRDQPLVLFLALAVLFVIQMSLGGKKGDRYILPSFLLLDLASLSLYLQLAQDKSRHILPTLARFSFIAAMVWQLGIIWSSHPHTMAYVNPLSRPWFDDRRHGWGEGLDLAAHYLNQKENAASLKVATFYPVEFASHFDGEAVPAHQHEEESVDYVIIYRAMFERGPDAWETDVVHYYVGKPAEKIFELSGLPMVWIYPRPTPKSQ